MTLPTKRPVVCCLAAMLAACLTANPGWAQAPATDPSPGPAASVLPVGIYPDAPDQLLAAVHAHTTASSGSDTMSQLSRRAASAGLDVVVLTENFGYEFRYAPLLIRPFLEARLSTPMIEDQGIEQYVAAVNEAERLNPEPLLLVGVEVPVYYYWTGSLFTGDLTLHDMQRNVLVVLPPESGGPSSTPVYDDARVRDFLEGLPTVGNRSYRHYGPGSLLLLLPGIALVLFAARSLVRGGVFRARPYRSPSRSSTDADRYVNLKPVHRQVTTWVQIAVLFAGIVLLSHNFPYSVASLQPYDAAAGHQPFEALFEHLSREDSYSFWSMSEAIDYHDFSFGPIGVKLSTDPYPGVLMETSGYTGFGGVYADTINTTRPGGEWDRAIASFQRGERAAFPALVGESAFHFAGQAGKELDDILTVLLVDRTDHAAAFESLVSGRSYSLRRGAGSPDLRLTEFAAARVDGSINGAAAARAGGTLGLESGELEIALRVDDESGVGVPVEVEVIRQGVLHRQFNGTTPVRLQWLETVAPEESNVFFRVMVRGPRPSYVVSNPIFVRRDSP